INFKLLVILLLLVFPVILFAQTDTVVNVEGLEFTDGAINADSLAFEESPDTAAAALDSAKTAVAAYLPASAETKAGTKSLWTIFIAGLVGGFAALLMPCIFTMLPLTVSYFTKQSGSRASGISKALLYGLFIIVIYVALGMIITIAFGSDALNALSTNGIFNFIFFLLLIGFAASFFGAFEITLPSSFVNKMDAKSDKGGLVGLFFMA